MEKQRGLISCFYCSQEGHIKRDCPKKKERLAANNSNFVCYNCNQRGHIKRNCPELCAIETISKKPTEENYHEAPIFSAADVAWPPVSQQLEVVGQNSTKVDVCGKTHMSATGNTTKSLPQSDTHSVIKAPISSNSDMKKDKAKGRCSNEACVGRCSNEACVGRCSNEACVGRCSNEACVGRCSNEACASGVKDVKIEREGIGGAREQRTPFPQFVDTHCHLEYIFERYNHTGSFSDFMKQWKYPQNFEGCIASFCDPAAFSSFGTWSDLLSEPDSKVWAAFGIHPHNAKYYFTQGLEEKLLKCIEHKRCVAFGEIGLDYGERSPSDFQTQKEVFARQLQLGVTLGKPFVLHCRDAEDDMMEILMKHTPQDWKIHFHCFTGKIETALKFLAIFPRSYLGVCGNVTYTNARNVIAVARKVPLNRLLIETDAPYNTPRNLPSAGRCRYSHPAHAHYVAKEIAQLKGLDLAEVLRVIRDNTSTMYGI